MWAAVVVARLHKVEPEMPDDAGVCQCRTCIDVRAAVDQAKAAAGGRR